MGRERLDAYLNQAGAQIRWRRARKSLLQELGHHVADQELPTGRRARQRTRPWTAPWPRWGIRWRWAGRWIGSTAPKPGGS